jgi:hypothetical protein
MKEKISCDNLENSEMREKLSWMKEWEREKRSISLVFVKRAVALACWSLRDALVLGLIFNLKQRANGCFELGLIFGGLEHGLVVRNYFVDEFIVINVFIIFVNGFGIFNQHFGLFIKGSGIFHQCSHHSSMVSSFLS